MEPELEKLRDVLIESSETLGRIRQDLNQLREELRDQHGLVKDALTELADRGLIEWEGPYRARKKHREESLKRSPPE